MDPLFILCFYVLIEYISSANNGIKLYNEYYKNLGKEDAFNKIFGLRLLKELTDPILRQNQYGFLPGLWGTEFLPINFWFYHLQMYSALKRSITSKPSKLLKIFLKDYYAWILRTNESILINMNWFKLTKLCDEIRFPRCSWKYFINIADPFGMDFNLLKVVNFMLPEMRYIYSQHDVVLKSYFVPVTLTDCYPIKNIDQLSAIYIYAVCFTYSKFLDSDSLRICPNPCHDFPCRSIRNADVNSCKHFGIYKRDFNCSCVQGYEWDAKSLSCLAKNYCFSVCDRKGTMKCNFLSTIGTVECICKSGYMAFDCSVLNNACIYGNNHPDLISGLEACNVAEGKNKCVPLLGTSSYSCGCSPPFIADRNIPYDNCMSTLEQCANRLCVYGSCETSPDGYRSYCQCDLDFKGEECDIPRGQWAPWSNWTYCFPECGNDSIKQRIRYCIGQIDDCVGQAEELRYCNVSACFYERPPEEITYDIFWTVWLITTITTSSYLILTVLISSILTLFRSQKTKTEKQLKKKKGKLKYKVTMHKLKKRFGLIPDAATIIETLDEIWNPIAEEDEMKRNLQVINQILMKLKKKDLTAFNTVAEKSPIAVLALENAE